MASTNRKIAIICGLALAGLIFFTLTRHSGRAQTNARLKLEGASVDDLTAAQQIQNVRSDQLPPVPPSIVTDTTTDSPGTNLATRVVTLTAGMGGTPPLFL